MNGIAIDMNSTHHYCSMFICHFFWLHISFCTSGSCLMKSITRIINSECNGLHTITMKSSMLRNRMIRMQSCSKYQPNFILFQYIRNFFTVAGLRA